MLCRSVAVGALCALAVAAQAPDVAILIGSRPDIDSALGAPFHPLAWIDGQTGVTTPVAGASDALHGRVGGVLVPGAGISAVFIDETDGTVFAATVAAAAGGTYGLYQLVLNAARTAVTVETTRAEWTASAAGHGFEEIEVLPNGDVLGLVTGGGPGEPPLVLIPRSGGAPTPWPLSDPLIGTPRGLAFDPVARGGAGEAILAIEGPPGLESIFVSVAQGGGAFAFITAFSPAWLFSGAAGGPSGLSLCPSGNLNVAMNDPLMSVVAVNRGTGVFVPGLYHAWPTGNAAVDLDLVRDAAVYAAAGTREVRRLVIPGTPTAETLATLPSGMPTAVGTSSGARMYGRAGGPAVNVLRVGIMGTAHVGNAAFGLRCVGGLPGDAGYLVLGAAPIAFDLGPYGVPGASLWASPDLLIPTYVGANYMVEVPLPLPAGFPTGLIVNAQFLNGAMPAASAGMRLVTLP